MMVMMMMVMMMVVMMMVVLMMVVLITEGEKQRHWKPFETICNFASSSHLVVALEGKRK